MVLLYDYQKNAMDSMRPGSVLCGGVGSGKSITSLSYFFTNICGGKINDDGSLEKMTNPIDLYIFTTAKKRDSMDWERECSHFLIGTRREDSMCNVKATVDSWNNIQKYSNLNGCFVIFDEQKVGGSGRWAKTFIKIARNNKWVLLSATPGDTWTDYISIFVANGFYHNRTEFYKRHVIFSRFTTYPKIERFIDIEHLIKLKRSVVINMEYIHEINKHIIELRAGYDKKAFDAVWNDRWDIFKDGPIENASQLCYAARKICNSDPSRIEQLKYVLARHQRVIIFYNFNYELDIIRSVLDDVGINYTEWNGQKHEQILNSDRWCYLVQYTSGSEAWRCVKTNCILFYSQNYSYKTLIQSMGRIDAVNTRYKDLYYYIIISKSSIDTAIKRCLDNKKDFNERL